LFFDEKNDFNVNGVSLANAQEAGKAFCRALDCGRRKVGMLE
jgi:hypothetical protein